MIDVIGYEHDRSIAANRHQTAGVKTVVLIVVTAIVVRKVVSDIPIVTRGPAVRT